MSCTCNEKLKLLFFFLSLAVDLLQEIECKMKEGFIKTQIDLAEWSSNVIEHGNHEMAGD